MFQFIHVEIYQILLKYQKWHAYFVTFIKLLIYVMGVKLLSVCLSHLLCTETTFFFFPFRSDILFLKQKLSINWRDVELPHILNMWTLTIWLRRSLLGISFFSKLLFVNSIIDMNKALFFRIQVDICYRSLRGHFD